MPLSLWYNMLVCVWVDGGGPGGGGGAARVGEERWLKKKKKSKETKWLSQRWQVRWQTLKRTTKQAKMITHEWRAAAFLTWLQRYRGVTLPDEGRDSYHRTETLRGGMPSSGWEHMDDGGGTTDRKKIDFLYSKAHLNVNSCFLLPDDQK